MLKGFTINSRQRKFLPELVAWQASGAGEGRRVCVVSSAADSVELIGSLQADGWRVTFLDVSKSDVPDQPVVGADYQRLVGLFQAKNDYIQLRSLLAYHWLRTQGFDLIIFHHSFAVGYYSLMARYLGLAFVGTPLVVFVETTHAVRLARTFTLPSGRHDFEIDFMERKTVELADGVLLNTVESGEELRELGWVFPPVVAVRRAVASVWGGWLEARIDGVKKARVLTSKPVFLSVCIATHNRAVWLREALVSLQNQTVSHFEVIVVDDGSTDRDVETLRAELAPVFHEKGWRWLQQDNAGPAAARYRAAKKASGEYLLFMDDDDIAYPDEIERFALAAQKKGDIIACILGMHPASENTFPATAQLPERNGTATRPVGWTPIGGDVALAAFINVAGYAHALYRRKMFLKLGGFKSGKEVVFEDFEFLIRALIAGYRIDVVPEVLMLYRRTRQSRSMGQDIFAGHLNSLQPLAALLPPALRGLLLPLRREWYERHRQRRDGEI